MCPHKGHFIYLFLHKKNLEECQLWKKMGYKETRYICRRSSQAYMNAAAVFELLDTEKRGTG